MKQSPKHIRKIADLEYRLSLKNAELKVKRATIDRQIVVLDEYRNEIRILNRQRDKALELVNKMEKQIEAIINDNKGI